MYITTNNLTNNLTYYLTIDVGTKNLAVCLCSHDTDKLNVFEKINIIEWNIIDVSFKPLHCKQIKNKRAICNCIAKSYSLIDTNKKHTDIDNLIGYCKNHSKNIKEHNKKKENKNNQIKLFNVNNNPIYKNNFSTQMEKLLYGLEKLYNEKILTSYNYYDSQLYFINNLNIYIENQPVLKNPIMKSISVGIYTFFCMKKLLNPKIISSINFINATEKTNKDFVEKLTNIIGIKSKIKDFKSYTNRKDFSEDIVNQIIPKLTYTLEYFNNVFSTSQYAITKKKDDLADTLLYQLRILTKKN